MPLRFQMARARVRRIMERMRVPAPKRLVISRSKRNTARMGTFATRVGITGASSEKNKGT